ncbi:M20/M25/M40 family metallo-hydrolase [Candidatus Halobonum tyrrellensis]|uniref:Deacylase n=1 Tax=Candidatus Halobonum tyrrellensis G22 TaxID=1324957 RepID=V4HBD5_9EURY|nr:M20/M25/M40 family metallo-hydrolase [Candidatus Halobonum tyrrellensis]ESP88020.1 deacylase [Candidatus Halobonum tyrrellensis G22]
MPTSPDASAADAVVAERFDGYRESLFDLLRLRTVSATGEGMADGADAVRAFFETYGFDARSVETDRYPLVYAERLAADPAAAPTVIFYGHYDVQPAEQPDEWETPAFEPTVRDGAVYARGAGDNKGQFAAHAFAVDALSRADALPDVNVKALVEGGEESGSRGLREYLDGGAPEVADADLVYVADGPQHRSGRPTLAYGNRGVLSFQLDLRTADADLHSGNFGGPVPNAATELVEIVGSMVDGDEVTVDGFHDGIEVSDADRDLVARLPDDGDAVREELGLTHLATEKPYYERLFLEPTLTVNGLDAGYQGEGGKTVIPHRATAKCDCRLVPGQDGDRVFERVREHVAGVHPDAEVTMGSTFPPAKTPVDAPAAAPVREALAAVWDADPVELPVLGGSLPAAFFREVEALSDVPVLVVPYANPDQGNHSPNEHLSLTHLENGIRTTAAFLDRFADADLDA